MRHALHHGVACGRSLADSNSVDFMGAAVASSTQNRSLSVAEQQQQQSAPVAPPSLQQPAMMRPSSPFLGPVIDSTVDEDEAGDDDDEEQQQQQQAGVGDNSDSSTPLLGGRDEEPGFVGFRPYQPRVQSGGENRAPAVWRPRWPSSSQSRQQESSTLPHWFPTTTSRSTSYKNFGFPVFSVKSRPPPKESVTAPTFLSTPVISSPNAATN
ncbi:unnamed protein product [Notodromas monacha]|uniref:Uncharacterized protein n=1 Tax=Notodromas monacha TaxID=399045 RepID=A0A7R9BL85_9CRUS|nr:unnamed protein product [Notodromas monacha]CAG0917545.1 unnamed protein product [Notodromas monacha]